MTSLASISILAGCAVALFVFVVVIVFLVLILDARQANEQARRHKENHDSIVRALRRKEDIDGNTNCEV